MNEARHVTTPSSTLGLSLIMLATGVGIPIMAALNSGLGARIGSPWVAAFILFVAGAVISGVVLAVIGLPPRLTLSAPPRFFLGGFLVAFYVLSVTAIAPRIGVGNAIFFVLLGQIVAAATIDQFGLFGAPEAPITARRWVGISCMVVGVFLARRV
jgi:transporter family-2 protein